MIHGPRAHPRVLIALAASSLPPDRSNWSGGQGLAIVYGRAVVTPQMFAIYIDSNGRRSVEVK